ncbi:MAG: hypothetical protein A2092_18635 [Rhodobacteraceae bacterium GWE1_64_9]|nr:MAG: hypothetical protein A2092_18635 [Rhodobacteraceae bacterium GWE1_64_9]OHC47213.1 MAG: hypothetical protein A2X69_18265 [Rhodobacteraceae bacterium GWF1_65_7]
MQLRRAMAGTVTALAVLSGCAVATVATSGAAKYDGIETILLDGDLVNFRVSMRGARNIQDVEVYARCAAAQYALIRGFGFARHVRTNVAQTGSTWRGDAIYTISAALPRGLRTIDAEVTVRDCGEQGIPTV